MAGLGDLPHALPGLVAAVEERNRLWAPGSHQRWGGGGGWGGSGVSPLSPEGKVTELEKYSGGLLGGSRSTRKWWAGER